MEKRLPVRSRIVLHWWAVLDRLTRELDHGELWCSYSKAKCAATTRNQGRRVIVLADGKTFDRFSVVRVRVEYDFARRYMAARMPVKVETSKVGDPTSDADEPTPDLPSVPLSKVGGATSDFKQGG